MLLNARLKSERVQRWVTTLFWVNFNISTSVNQLMLTSFLQNQLGWPLRPGVIKTDFAETNQRHLYFLKCLRYRWPKYVWVSSFCFWRIFGVFVWFDFGATFERKTLWMKTTQNTATLWLPNFRTDYQCHEVIDTLPSVVEDWFDCLSVGHIITRNWRTTSHCVYVRDERQFQNIVAL